MNKVLSTTVLIWCLGGSFSYSQGIVGTVYNTEGTALEFATLYIQELGTGSASNIQGNFKMNLAPGRYHIVFQHLGYKPNEMEITVGASYLELKVVLQPETIVLQNVVVNAKNEDPAYTIMRKAIAKAKYHRQQINSFETEAYVKGSGRLISSPFFLRKAIEKEGVDSTTSFTSETVSKIKFNRPFNFSEEVISVRSNGDDYGTNPSSFILGSIYQPMYVGAVSPLSPKAFAYYKFEYLGTKNDRGNEISKIKITPRSRGDKIFEGELSIVEDDWSVQSASLTMLNAGITFVVNQIYEPVMPHVWMPISHKFDVTGKVFGFKFEYSYLSTMGKYKIEINPDLPLEFEVIDEKIEKEEAKKLVSNTKSEVEQQLNNGGEVTRKQLRKLIKDYEKEERKKDPEPMLESTYKVKIDSLAPKSDTTYWASIRPVPLTEYEIKGYHKLDSISLAEKAEAEGDTAISNKKSNFDVGGVFTNYTFKLSDSDRLTYYSPFTRINFNTIEGFNVGIKFKYAHTYKSKNKLFVWPEAKYGFSSNRFYARVHSEYRFGPLYKRSSIRLNGGVFYNQINNTNPIAPLVNTITSLLWKGNYMKLYQSNYVATNYKGYVTDKLSYELGFILEQRTPLFNNTDYTWSKKTENYTPNAPENIEVPTTDFVEQKAALLSGSITLKPWLAYKIHNQSKQVANPGTASFSLHYKGGIPMGNFSGSDFSWFEIEYNQTYVPGIRGVFYFNAHAGAFLAKAPTNFIDFNHFKGNESPFLMNDPVGSFRLLPYYTYSTSDKYALAQVMYQFRKFLITQLPIMRLTGVKELAYLSYVATPALGNYIEIGYGLDNLFRLFRIETTASFIDGTYQGFSVKIGLGTAITVDGGSGSISF